jgi:hypothetical protein
MNDTIRVGDRVQNTFSTEAHGTVLAAGPDWLYVQYDNGHNEAWLTGNCRRIEPEPVTLTPKFKMGQEVLCDGLGISTINGVFVGYTVKEHGGIWLNGDLEAVPEPCEK